MATKHPFRKTELSRHHLIPRCRGGYGSPKNILRLWRDSHNFWHNLFGRSTLDEIIVILSQPHCRRYEHPSWKLLFKDKTPHQVSRILWRVKLIKMKLKRKP